MTSCERPIAHVREQHPYWDRKNGADHFMVFSYDHGRCDMAPGLQHEEFGRMFASSRTATSCPCALDMPSTFECPQNAGRSCGIPPKLGRQMQHEYLLHIVVEAPDVQ